QAGSVKCVIRRPRVDPRKVPASLLLGFSRSTKHSCCDLRFMSLPVAASRLRFRSKTSTAGLAFLLGGLGAHRFYLYGAWDAFGWAHVVGTLLGIPGVSLLVASARISTLGWILAMPGAISVLAGFLAAIVYGLRPD